MTDHERIWLQHPDDADGQETGRMWCQDKVWPEHPEDHEPTEYVRADLYAAEIERLQTQLYHATAAVVAIREHALEEAAQAAEINNQHWITGIDRAIRSLKEQK